MNTLVDSLDALVNITGLFLCTVGFPVIRVQGLNFQVNLFFKLLVKLVLGKTDLINTQPCRNYLPPLKSWPQLLVA